MKIQFLATGHAPDSYEISGEQVTAYSGDKSESIDLSELEEGGQYQGIELDTLDLPDLQVIRNAKRIDGELRVTLCQQANSGNWRKSDWMNASDYDSKQTYIKEVDNNGDTKA